MLNPLLETYTFVPSINFDLLYLLDVFNALDKVFFDFSNIIFCEWFDYAYEFTDLSYGTVFFWPLLLGQKVSFCVVLPPSWFSVDSIRVLLIVMNCEVSQFWIFIFCVSVYFSSCCILFRISNCLFSNRIVSILLSRKVFVTCLYSSHALSSTFLKFQTFCFGTAYCMLYFLTNIRGSSCIEISEWSKLSMWSISSLWYSKISAPRSSNVQI